MGTSFLLCILAIFASVEGFEVQQACPQVCPEPLPCEAPPPPPPLPPQPQPEVICNCLQFCPEPPPPCPSQTESAPLLLHQNHRQHKRQAEEIETEQASPDSGLTSESTSSTDADTDSTERSKCRPLQWSWSLSCCWASLPPFHLCPICPFYSLWPVPLPRIWWISCLWWLSNRIPQSSTILGELQGPPLPQGASPRRLSREALKSEVVRPACTAKRKIIHKSLQFEYGQLTFLLYGLFVLHCTMEDMTIYNATK